jgi:hypothetical protein
VAWLRGACEPPTPDTGRVAQVQGCRGQGVVAKQRYELLLPLVLGEQGQGQLMAPQRRWAVVLQHPERELVVGYGRREWLPVVPVIRGSGAALPLLYARCTHPGCTHPDGGAGRGVDCAGHMRRSGGKLAYGFAVLFHSVCCTQQEGSDV